MSTAPEVVLAQLLKRSAEVYESSWDSAAHSRDWAHTQDEQLRNPLAWCMRNDYYTLTLEQAVNQVCAGEHAALAEPVHLMLADAWHQTLEWADKIIPAVKPLTE